MSSYEFIKKIGLANTECESLGNMAAADPLTIVAYCSSNKCSKKVNSALGTIVARGKEAKFLQKCPKCNGTLFFRRIKIKEIK